MAKHAAISKPKKKRKLSLGKKILIGVVSVFAVAAIGVGALCAVWLQDLPECDEATIDSASITTVYANDGETVLARFQLQNRIPISSLDETSKLAINGTIATEDERFYSHGAVDIFGIVRAVFNNATGGSREGASTITQQLVRNTVLADEMNDISLKRKLREAVLAYQVESRYSKDQILLMYLNAINYGSGAYGIEAASRRYFSKPSTDLTLSEAATLICVPQSPTYNNPLDNPANAKTRRDLVLDRMVSNGYATQEEAAQAKSEEITLELTDFSKDGIIQYPYFTSYVRDTLLGQLSFDEVFQGGLTVYSTLDVRIQEFAEEAALDKANEAGPKFECAMTAIDPNTGYVKAMVGGRDYYQEQWNLAAQGKRQAGSSFKTFTLVTALEKGISPTTSVNCYPTVKIGDWNVHNAGSHDYGRNSIAGAFAVSSNTGFARIITAVGPSSVVEVAHRMGIKSYLEAVPALTLGVEEVSTLEMADAYATIANGGTHYEAVVVEKVIDRKGRVVIDNTNPKGQRALSPEIAHAATEVMKGVITGGTGGAARLKNGQVAAGKTGTTDNNKDKWFCGITPQLSVAIWLGDRNNVYAPGPTAVSAFSAFMNDVLEGQELQDFPEAGDPVYTKKFKTADLDLEGLSYSDPDKDNANNNNVNNTNAADNQPKNTVTVNTGGSGTKPASNTNKPAANTNTNTNKPTTNTNKPSNGSTGGSSGGNTNAGSGGAASGKSSNNSGA